MSQIHDLSNQCLKSATLAFTYLEQTSSFGINFERASFFNQVCLQNSISWAFSNPLLMFLENQLWSLTQASHTHFRSLHHNDFLLPFTKFFTIQNPNFNVPISIREQVRPYYPIFVEISPFPFREISKIKPFNMFNTKPTLFFWSCGLEPKISNWSFSYRHPLPIWKYFEVWWAIESLL